jgi:hypothetical protein
MEIKFLSIQTRYRVSGSRLYRETRLDADVDVNRPISNDQVGISSGNQALTRGALSIPIRNWLKYGRAADCPSSTLPVSRPSSPTIRSSPVWSLPSSLCLSQHHSRPPGRRFVIPHHSLRFLRLVRCQIMRPPKPDGLKPKFRSDSERSRCVPG